MAIRPESERRFDKASPVGRYWLAQCEGFRVRGPLKGTVEEIVGSVDPQDAEALVVRRGFRSHTIPVAAVESVIPAARVVVVDARWGEPSHASARAVTRASARAATTVGATVARRGPPFVRFLFDGALAMALLLASTFATFARVAKVTGARLYADVRARRRAAADRRRVSADARRPRAREGRTLSRAAVLGVERKGGRRP